MSYGPATTLGHVVLQEVSGLAPASSGRSLWVEQDSGNPAVLQRLDRRGRVVATYRVGAQNHDWEDLAAARDADGAASLYVADIGDNRGRRAQVQVLRVAEPAVGTTRLGAVTTYRLRYEDGPHDAEALLVLPGARQVAVVTKALAGAGVYTAPLRAGAVQVLRRVADLDLATTGTPGGPVGSFGQLLVTGGAVSPDGRRLALRTYTDLYEWPLGTDLAAVFAAPGTRTALPPTRQGEAVAYERDGSGVLLAGEGVGSPLQRLPRSAPAPRSPTPTVTPTRAAAVPASQLHARSRSRLPALAVGGLLALVAALALRRWTAR